MTIDTLGLVAVLLLVFALISKRLGETVLTAPMFFTGAGLVLGHSMLDRLHLPSSHEVVRVVAEATLVFVLFSDAAMIDLRRLRTEFRLPARLLGIGLPTQIALGTGLALLCFPELTLWQAALLSSVLAPTDAALGQLVVSSERVPERLRQTLAVESGLNDGLVLPVVTIFLATCLSIEQAQPTGEWVAFVLRQIGFGTLCGIAVGAGFGWLMRQAHARSLMAPAFERIASLGVAVLAYAAAHSLGGNGFIAAFVAGLVFGAITRSAFEESLLEFTEEEGQLLSALTFLVFGATLLDPALFLAPRTLLFAIGCLTVVRALPMALALVRTDLSAYERLFVGWFGPRGVASILFALLIVEASSLNNRDLITSVAFVTVALSIVLHGISAAPAAERFPEGSE